MMAKTQTTPINDSPAALVSIAKAAHLTGDRDLERAAKQLLEERHCIHISFGRRPAAKKQEAAR
jgi:hypothetical protein